MKELYELEVQTTRLLLETECAKNLNPSTSPVHRSYQQARRWSLVKNHCSPVRPLLSAPTFDFWVRLILSWCRLTCLTAVDILSAI